MKKGLLALLLWGMIAPTLTLAEQVVEVIGVYYRPASEIQPLLLPLLEDADKVVANGDSLIVKTNPGRLQIIANLIRKLDTPLNNLLITVIQSHDLTAENLNAGVDFDINIPFDANGEPTPHWNSRIYGQGSKIHRTKGIQNTQTIRTTDGATAHIQAGQSVPVTNYQIFPGGYGYPGVTQSTQYIEATTGFAVTPRLVGQQVILDVSPWSDRFNRNGDIQTQEAQTSIRANLGEWVDLGGVDESGQSSANGLFAYRRQTSQSNLHILVKVDVIN